MCLHYMNMLQLFDHLCISASKFCSALLDESVNKLLKESKISTKRFDKIKLLDKVFSIIHVHMY